MINVEILKNGMLVVYPSNETEAYTLRKWKDEYRDRRVGLLISAEKDFMGFCSMDEIQYSSKEGTEE